MAECDHCRAVIEEFCALSRAFVRLSWAYLAETGSDEEVAALAPAFLKYWDDIEAESAAG